MKKLTLFLTLISAITAWSQGGVNFNNHVPGSVDAPVSYDIIGPVPGGRVDGATAIPFGDRVWGGVNALAGLYYGPAGTPENALMQLGEPVHFRTGAAAGYFNGGVRAVPGVALGSAAVFQVRAWDVGLPNILSYEAALATAQNSEGYFGRSVMLNLLMTGGTVDLNGLQPFMLTAPEPATVIIILVGVLAGFLFRRRQ